MTLKMQKGLDEKDMRETPQLSGTPVTRSTLTRSPLRHCVDKLAPDQRMIGWYYLSAVLSHSAFP